jgi:hypothetical protein
MPKNSAASDGASPFHSTRVDAMRITSAAISAPATVYRPISKLKNSAMPAKTPLNTADVLLRRRSAFQNSATAATCSSVRLFSTVVHELMATHSSASGIESKTTMPRNQIATGRNAPRTTVRVMATPIERPKISISQASSWPSSSMPCSAKTSRYGTLPRR